MNTSIDADSIDQILLQNCNAQNLLPLDGFVRILREYAVDYSRATQVFFEMSVDGEVLDVETCQVNLLPAVEEMLGVASCKSWCHGLVLDCALEGSDAFGYVSKEMWLDCCQRLARIIRVAYGSGANEILVGAVEDDDSECEGAGLEEEDPMVTCPSQVVARPVVPRLWHQEPCCGLQEIPASLWEGPESYRAQQPSIDEPLVSQAQQPSIDEPLVNQAFEQLLSDLEAAEHLIYGDVFSGFPLLQGGVHVTDFSLRTFLLTNSGILEDELDLKLRNVATSQNLVFEDGFIRLLRENAMDEYLALQFFMGIGGQGESVDHYTCRKSLLLCVGKSLGVRLGNGAACERILEIVMSRVDNNVSQDAWVKACQEAARIARLAHGCGAADGLFDDDPPEDTT